MSADLLALLVRATLVASAALCVILLLRRPIRAAFGAQVAYAFWLLAPVATLATFLPARQVLATAPIGSGAIAPVSAAPVETIQAAATQPIMEIAATLPIDAAIDFAPMLLFIWLSGVFFSVFLLLRKHRRFMRTAATAGPAVVGILRPRIILPADFEVRYTHAERDLVVAHERAHIAAFDAQINAIAALAQCLNWFNPLFHVARKALRIDQELACDARVIARHTDAKRIYAEAMLKTQLAAQPVPLGCARRQAPEGAHHHAVTSSPECAPHRSWRRALRVRDNRRRRRRLDRAAAARCLRHGAILQHRRPRARQPIDRNDAG